MFKPDSPRLASVSAALLVCLFAAACVPTDPPQDNADDGYEPYYPDMKAPGADDGLADADMGSPGDAGPDVGGDMPGEVNNASSPDMKNASTFCMPDRDGKITRAEMPLREGLYATFEVAADAEVDTAGETLEDGSRAWDLDVEFAGDRRVLLEAQEPTGRWFSTDFPDATYVAELSASSDLLGIFKLDDDALSLLGVVSPEDGLTATKLTYDPPVTILDFPIEQDKSWETETSISGTAQGVLAFYSEDYSSQVDAHGTMATPYGSFPVLRVRTDLSRLVGLLGTDIRTYAFVSECFGTVATIVSEDNEEEVEFTTAAEVRRLTQ